jgi:hypothetical protein
MSALPLLLLAVVAIGYTLWPLLTGVSARMRTSRSDTAIGRLELRKEILLENLADLDFEHAMGKLAGEDHAALRASIEEQALAVLEQLEVLRGARGEDADATGDDEATAAYCHQCGASLPENARVCPACGEKVAA